MKLELMNRQKQNLIKFFLLVLGCVFVGLFVCVMWRCLYGFSKSVSSNSEFFEEFLFVEKRRRIFWFKQYR